jgi:hypothetical protein
MTAIIKYSETQKIFGTKPELPPSIIVTETPLGGISSSEVISLGDANMTRATVTPTTNNCDLNVLRFSDDQAHAFVSMTPEICSVSPAGGVAHISDGLGKIAVHTPYHIIGFNRNLSDGEIVIAEEWVSWNANSLSAYLDSTIRSMIANKTPGAATQAVLSSTSGGVSNPNHIRNANLFTGALDLSAISIYGTAFNCNIFPVVLISPRHVMAGHVGASPGQQVVFKTPSGSYEIRTVISQFEIEPRYGSDFVGLLDTEITTIVPMKLLPPTWASYIPSCTHYEEAYFTTKIPVLNKGWAAGDYIRILEIRSVVAYTFQGAHMPYLWAHDGILGNKPLEPAFQPWSSEIIGGDSNGPIFMPINGEPVLLHCMNFSGGGGKFYPDISANIQAAMTSLGPGSLTYADLTGFASY